MQIKSKDRVANHGEVFTNIREVNAMLDLVKDETHRIDSRFLEPACGTGNFLIEVLRRKLEVVESRYKKSKIEFERYSILALSSIYGIDILEDNLKECKTRLYELFLNFYKSIFKKDIDDRCLKSAKFILDKNIIWGDALTLLRVDGSNLPIVFSEWSAVNGSFLKRRDFTLNELLRNSTSGDLGLFSDLGDEAFIPTPIKEYPLTHFLEIYND
jgi:hypothetical protein